jgi:hypothetical protein
MLFIKRTYDYFFYKLYKSFEAAPSRWLSDWKASFFLMVIEIWIGLSILNYFSVLYPKIYLRDRFLTVVSISIVIGLVAVKYFSFEYKDRWKSVIKTFDELPKNKNEIGTHVVWGIVLLILGNLIFSFYLLSKSV